MCARSVFSGGVKTSQFPDVISRFQRPWRTGPLPRPPSMLSRASARDRIPSAGPGVTRRIIRCGRERLSHDRHRGAAENECGSAGRRDPCDSSPRMSRVVRGIQAHLAPGQAGGRPTAGGAAAHPLGDAACAGGGCRCSVRDRVLAAAKLLPDPGSRCDDCDGPAMPSRSASAGDRGRRRATA